MCNSATGKEGGCKIEVDEAVLMTLVLREKYCLHQLIRLCPVHFLPNGAILFFFFSPWWLHTSLHLLLLVIFMFSCNDSWQKPREQGSLHCECVGGQGKSDNNSKCSKFVESRRSERVEAKTTLLSCARLLELLKSCWRGEVHAFCSVEAAVGGETGIRAPSEMDFFPAESGCKMA